MKLSTLGEVPQQLGHFVWAGASTVGVVAGSWWGLLGLLSWFLIILRECWQKRDERGGIFGNWPGLDSIFYGLGIVAGALCGMIAFSLS